MREHVIEARNITKNYGDTLALKNLDLTVRRGDIYGLVGDNGAGKTTFLKLVTGQIYATEGELKLFGTYTEKELQKNRKRMGAIVEAPGFYPGLTVEQNLEYYRIQRGMPGRNKVAETLKVVGLWEARRKKGTGLSLGMKQRLGLAIALLGEPELLILDEPINGLDPSGIIEMRNLLLKLNREKNITIIISSHILSELEQIAGVYGFLNQGYLVRQVAADKLREECAGYVEIVVTEPEKYAALLEKEFPEEQYQVMPDKGIQIRNPKQETEVYSNLATKHDMGILRLETRQMPLEEYYMHLKEGGRIIC